MDWIVEQPNGALGSSQITKSTTRKPHTKSRRGCNSCKKKRIKCDEVEPTCTQCSYRKIKCVYSFATPSPREHPNPSHNITSSKSRESLKTATLQFMESQDIPCDRRANPKYKRLDALEILDHFFETPDLCHWASEMRKHLVDLGLETPHLLHSILAFSASHLSHFQPGNWKYEIASTIHYHKALIMYLTVISQGVESDNAEQLLATCFVLRALAFWSLSQPEPVSLDLEKRELLSKETLALNFDTTRNYNNMTWLRAWQGSQILLKHPATQKHLEKGIWEEAAHQSIVTQDDTRLTKSFTEKSSMSKALQSLQNFCNVGFGPPVQGPYEAPIDHLRQLLPAGSRHKAVGQLISWIENLSLEFISLLEQRDPKASLILAYWCAMFSQVNIWWVTRSANKLCLDFCAWLDHSSDSTLKALLDSPRSVCQA